MTNQDREPRPEGETQDPALGAVIVGAGFAGLNMLPRARFAGSGYPDFFLGG